jgi:hypothetical protein
MCLGVPRLKEIIYIAINIKTPSLSVYLELMLVEWILETDYVNFKAIDDIDFTCTYSNSCVEVFDDRGCACLILRELRGVSMVRISTTDTSRCCAAS